METMLSARQKNVQYRVVVEDMEERNIEVRDCHFESSRKVVPSLGKHDRDTILLHLASMKMKGP